MFLSQRESRLLKKEKEMEQQALPKVSFNTSLGAEGQSVGVSKRAGMRIQEGK